MYGGRGSEWKMAPFQHARDLISNMMMSQVRKIIKEKKKGTWGKNANANVVS